MAIYSEETVEVSFGSGLYSADLPSAIPDGFCAAATNVVPVGTSVESRYGFRKSSVPFAELLGNNVPDREEIFMSRMESNAANVLPSLVWGGKSATNDNNMYMLRDGDVLTNPITPVITDGYAVIDLAALGFFRGALNYNGRMYFNTTTGVYKINSITWSATPSISSTSVTGPVGCDTGLFHFQDRIWTSVDNIIYYTDAPSSPGGFPETWAISTNFIVIVGEKGPATIYKMIPLGTRIYIFTSQGLFVLSIYGTPTDWYLKALDSKVRVNTISCAFEVSGIIYYICSLGVFATTGSSTVKLSGAIENLFLAGNQVSGDETGIRKFTEYRIHYLDGGMLVSISPQILKLNSGSIAQPFYAGEECKTLYSRTDSVAWSEWELPPSNWDTEDALTYDRRINAVLAVADNIQTYVNNTPLSYVWMAHSNSLSTDTPVSGVKLPILELFNYDGFQDSWTAVIGDAAIERWVHGLIRSSYFDGGNPIALKEVKRAFLELFLPNAEAYANKTELDVAAIYWRYKWLTDQRTYTPENRVLYQQETPDTFAQEFSMLQLATGFMFRTAQLELRFSLTDDTNYKIKSAYLKDFTIRDGIKHHQ